MLSLLLMLQVATTELPSITLDEALRRSRTADPEYVAAERAVGTASWARRAAWSSMFLPTINATSNASKFSTPQFNFGTGLQQDVAVSAQIDARYDLFLGGRKLAELRRSGAEIARAAARETEARYETALRTEQDYYDVLAQQELERVASERVRRAREQLVIARARVVSGAAVATDSLQLLLELNEAQVAALRQGTALRVSRLQLGRRVGMDGPVQAAPLATDATAELPIALEQAIAESKEKGPSVVAARATEDAAGALVRAQRGFYFPQLSVTGTSSAFDDRYFPQATTRQSLTLSVSVPIWNNAQRELAVEQAKAQREVARATRLDVERGTERDVTAAYEEYTTARATVELRESALVVARENYRVQETRYKAGATTILDLLTAQVQLTEAESNLVQARFASRLALAELEALLGRRLFNDRTSP
ncbi:MAG TPA: TolC family protein [Gemmatimonadaceae bacterium]|jgi:outer membrane protein|nr:TolC family protein [Gemmatimonadaceae bacterium]